jgi:hypothetical protein
MRIKIDTTGIQFQVASLAKPKTYGKDENARQATTQDGRLLWSVRLTAIDTARETSESIWVEVAGDQPKLTFNGFVVLHELVYAPWVGKTDHKLHRAFRADAIDSAPGSKQSDRAA